MSTVQVQLLDAATGAALGVVDLSPDELPESFAVATTLHLGDVDWRVERAEPESRAAAVATGALRLTLRRVPRLDPRDILFSLPTLEDKAPPLEPGAVFLDLHEDDWRQVELVASRFEPEIAAELADIRAILRDHAVGAGFRKLHVRRRIPRPLGALRVAVETLGATLGGAPRATVGLSGRMVAGGFAFGGVYGLEEDGVVTCIACAPGTDPSPLRSFAREHELLLVDWVEARSRHL